MTTQSESPPSAKPTLLLKPPANNGLHPGGRPSYTLTPEQRLELTTLAQIGVPKYLIAQRFGIAKATVDDNHEFSELYEKNYPEAGIKVARKQFELLESDKAGALMAIWLGKQHLGQSDRSEQHTSGEVQIRVTLTSKVRGARLDTVEGEVRELPAPETGLTDDKGT